MKTKEKRKQLIEIRKPCGYKSPQGLLLYYHDGQYIFIKSVESLEPDEIGIFFYDGNVYIKMLDTSEDTVDDEFGEVTTEHHIYLVSLNEKYKPIPIENEAPFRVLGKVLN